MVIIDQLVWLDGQLIDRVFQPIANRAEGYAGPSSISGSFLMGASVMAIGLGVSDLSLGAPLDDIVVDGILAATGWYAWMLSRLTSDAKFSATRLHPMMIMNRLSTVLGCLIVGGVSIAGESHRAGASQLFDVAFWLLSFCGQYFFACRKPPPRRRAQEADSGIYRPVAVR